MFVQLSFVKDVHQGEGLMGSFSRSLRNIFGKVNEQIYLELRVSVVVIHYGYTR